MLNRKISVAPMMEYTDRHARYFLRLLSKKMLLYTEMVTTGALIYGDAASHLKYNQEEHPIAIQLGGSDPKHLVECAKMSEDWGYDEVNLNVGCPSDRVQNGKFGACLMATPDLVAECVSSMQNAVKIPITIKCRLGIDQHETYEEFFHFIEAVEKKGSCTEFIVHARKAWLQGLNPKQNRDIPPLRYDWVHRLKQERPHLNISINGGIKTLAEAQKHLEVLDGVMIGREACHNPYILAEVDQKIYGEDTPIKSRHEILEEFIPYIEKQIHDGTYLTHMSRHLLGLFLGLPGAKRWRRYISENAYKQGAGIEVLREAEKQLII
ncbi:MAG: tRNA-dihydrouridine synthase A [bacterium]|jgi:tRNA-dihydrouridine synthase A